MSTKLVKRYLPLSLILVAFISSLSVEKLDEARAKAGAGKFDPAGYAENFWTQDLLPSLDEAVEASYLIDLLGKNPDAAFDDHSRALGIGNIRFFMIRGEGKISQIDEDEIIIRLKGGNTEYFLRIATEYIFGNAVRDASGKVDMLEFDQTMDFNNVSAEINQLIRREVLPGLKQNARINSQIYFVGAFELNKEQVAIENIAVIPVYVEFTENKPSDD